MNSQPFFKGASNFTVTYKGAFLEIPYLISETESKTWRDLLAKQLQKREPERCEAYTNKNSKKKSTKI